MDRQENTDKDLIIKLISSMIEEINSQPSPAAASALARAAHENGFEPSNAQSSFISQAFQALNDRHNVIYEFVMRYTDYIYAEHDYGDGHRLTMVEVHTLTYIEDHPGTTITELTAYWHKTKGMLSQIVSRLVSLGLVNKTKKGGTGKNVYLHVTPAGFQVSRSHKLYDILDITKTLSQIQRECSPEEIDTFYKVLSVYYKVISKDFEENKIPRRYGKRRCQEDPL